MSEGEFQTPLDRFAPKKGRALAWIVMILLLVGIPVGGWFSWNKWFAGIHPLGGNMFRITSGEYFMTLTQVETSYAPVRLFVSRGNVLPPDARVLIRMVSDPGLAAAAGGLKMTPDQVKQVVGFRAQLQGGMKIEPADRDKLAADWKAWTSAKDAAAKSAAEKPLLVTMKEVGHRSVDATRKQYSDIAEQIRKIVNDDQINRYKQLRGL
jgi:hypothetical protein